MEAIHSYRDLVVWQRAVELAVATYELTERFPVEERYALTTQIRRAAISISSNIAEGRFRGTRRDFTQFLRIAYGSGAELGSQLEVAKRLRATKRLSYVEVERLLGEVMKMLSVMIRRLGSSSSVS